jgi:hypothetical protein
MRVGPAPPDEGAVPVEDRPGRDEERASTVTRYETGEQRDRLPVGPGEAWTGGLATQHSQLVPEHEDLRILGRRVHRIGRRPVRGRDR